MNIQSITNPTLEDIINEVDEIIKKKTENKINNTKTVAVAMFDLPGSTQLKLIKGHTIGTNKAIRHNLICERISRKYGGNVIKYMGDGIFIEFMDPIKACEAALEIKIATHEKPEFVTKGGITIGVVENIEIIEGLKDLMGSTIDRCARIASFASENQILMDQILLDATYSFLRNNDNVQISDVLKINAKGIGKLNVFEISLKSIGFSDNHYSPLNLIEEGRMPLNEKMDYLMTANKEIIELGIGLTSFSDNFTRARNSEFKKKIISLLERGVKIELFALDPDSEAAKITMKYNDELKYIEKMNESLEKLNELKREFSKKGLINFNIYLYDELPRFHASCIDLDELNGKLSISHYLPKTPRADNPVIQFSKVNYPVIYNKYVQIIKKIKENSNEY